MKSIIAAAALSLLAVSAAHASGIASAEASELRTVELTNARQIHDAGSSSITVTVGTPKELSAVVLPPRDRVEAGYKAGDSVTFSVFPSIEGYQDNRR